jgi:hypothetical protein
MATECLEKHVELGKLMGMPVPSFRPAKLAGVR